MLVHDPDEAADLPGGNRMHMVDSPSSGVNGAHADSLPGFSQIGVLLLKRKHATV